MRLTEHFALEEFTNSYTATRLSIDNHAAPDIMQHLMIVADGLERVRVLLGNRPIHVNSGYRCPELNRAVGGAEHSAHMSGYAADIVCPEFGSPLDIVRAVAASDISFDRCIMEGTWCHISFAPERRRQVETAHFADGKVTYTMGVADG